VFTVEISLQRDGLTSLPYYRDSIVVALNRISKAIDCSKIRKVYVDLCSVETTDGLRASVSSGDLLASSVAFSSSSFPKLIVFGYELKRVMMMQVRKQRRLAENYPCVARNYPNGYCIPFSARFAISQTRFS
jgi:hypothetical protein